MSRDSFFICSITGCQKPVQGNGICDMHYKRLIRTGDARGRDGTPRGPRFDMPVWPAQPACAGRLDIDWTPAENTNTSEAIAVCRACHVRVQCLSWALDVGERGIWGGLTDSQRAAMRRTA